MTAMPAKSDSTTMIQNRVGMADPVKSQGDLRTDARVARRSRFAAQENPRTLRRIVPPAGRRVPKKYVFPIQQTYPFW
jgi:hypothetical protein